MGADPWLAYGDHMSNIWAKSGQHKKCLQNPFLPIEESKKGFIMCNKYKAALTSVNFAVCRNFVG